MITGRLYDAKTKEGVEGIRVQITSKELKPGFTQEKSDCDGNYRITGLADGTYRVLPGLTEGYLRMPYKNWLTVKVKNGKAVKNIDFAFEKGISLAGMVIFADGQPVPEASVRARMEYKNWSYGGAAEATSKEDGSFEIQMPEYGTGLRIQAQTDDFESEMLGPMKLPKKGLDNVVLRMTRPRTASIAGVVVDPLGRPVRGSSVILDRGDSGPLVSGGYAKAMRDGSFLMKNLVAGNFGLVVTEPGISSWNRKLDKVMDIELAEGQQLEGLRIVLGEDKGGLAIAGRVVDTAGNPVSKAQIDCYLPTAPCPVQGRPHCRLHLMPTWLSMLTTNSCMEAPTLSRFTMNRV
ncbi:hypothetical protein ACFL1X_09105 [Candidatus Hydrogenedentota bacterium]